MTMMETLKAVWSYRLSHKLATVLALLALVGQPFALTKLIRSMSDTSISTINLVVDGQKIAAMHSAKQSSLAGEHFAMLKMGYTTVSQLDAELQERQSVFEMDTKKISASNPFPFQVACAAWILVSNLILFAYVMAYGAFAKKRKPVQDIDHDTQA